MPTARTIASAIAGTSAMILAHGASAQAVSYTDAQAAQGAASYTTNCSACHGANGQGAEGTALIGAQFDSWRGGPALALYDYMSQLMPESKPGSLPKEAYTLILTHILKINGVPSGTEALATPPPPGLTIPK